MKNKENKECEFCGESATCFCFECINYYCDKCYKFIHDMPKNSKHKRENIDPYFQIDIKCPDHPKIPMNLFCSNEKGKYYFFILFIICNRAMLFILPLFGTSFKS